MSYVKYRLLMFFVFFMALLNTGESQNGKSNRIVVNVDLGKDTISKFIYGHFAEHLGHCIYGGIYVGEDSDIPNTRGIRNDVVKALREISVPNVRWPFILLAISRSVIASR